MKTRSKLLVAGSAAAISTIGLLTVPATAHAAPSCTFAGTFIINQSNGYRVEVPWNGKSPAGTATASGNNQVLTGPVTGGITSAGNEVAFTVDWNGPPHGQYVGTFDAGGNVRGGFNQDLRAGSKASWDSVTPFTCVAEAASPPPSQQAPPPTEAPPPVAETKPLQGPTVTPKEGLGGVTFTVTDRSGVASQCTYSSEGFDKSFGLPANKPVDVFVPAVRLFRQRNGTVTCDNGTSTNTSVFF
jgi:hypothetical protein